MGNIGWQQLLIVAIIFIVLFGAKKLPETAKGLATSLRVFKKEIATEDDQSKNEALDANGEPVKSEAADKPATGEVVDEPAKTKPASSEPAKSEVAKSEVAAEKPAAESRHSS